MNGRFYAPPSTAVPVFVDRLSRRKSPKMASCHATAVPFARCFECQHPFRRQPYFAATLAESITHCTLQVKSCAKGQAPLESLITKRLNIPHFHCAWYSVFIFFLPPVLRSACSSLTSRPKWNCKYHIELIMWHFRFKGKIFQKNCNETATCQY